MFFTLQFSELRLQWRQPLFWALLIIAPLFGYFVGLGISTSQSELFQRFHLQHVTGSLSMMALPWVSVLLAVTNLFRDQHSDMSDLLGALPITSAKRQAFIVVGLLLSIYGLCAIAVGGLFIGLLQQAQILPPALELLIVFLKLQGLVLIQIAPALMLFLATFWLLCNMSAPPIVLYLAALLLFGSYMAISSATGSPLMTGSQTSDPILKTLWSYLDWFGLDALFAKEASWFVFLINRIIIITASLIIGCTAIKLSRSSGLRQQRGTKKPVITSQSKVLHPQRVTFISVMTSPYMQILALVRFQINQLIIRPGALFLSLVWCVIIYIETFPFLHVAELGATLSGLSYDAINRFMWDLVPLFGSLLLLYVSCSLTWLDEHYRFGLVTEALPVSFPLRLFSQIILLFVILALFLMVTCLASITSQLAGDSTIHMVEYARFLIYAGIPLATKGLAFLALLATVKKRVLAVGLCILILIFEFTPLPSLIGLHHPLFILYSSSLQNIDSLLGYAPYNEGFWMFNFFWLTISVGLMLISLMCHPVQRRPSLLTKYGLLLAPIVLVLVIQANNINDQLAKDGKSLSSKERQQLLASYEYSYREFLQLPMPSIDEVTTYVELYPQQRKVIIMGSYQLSNPHKVPIKKMLVGENWRKPLKYIKVEQAAQMSYDKVQGQRVYKFDSALEPGQKTKLHFSLELEQSGYQEMSHHKVLTSEFVYLRAIPYFPELGYQTIRELSDNDLRREYGLNPHPDLSTEDKLRMRNSAQDTYQWSQLKTTISAPVGFQSFSQGELVAQWQEKGRIYRKFETTSPVRRVQAFIASPSKLEQRKIGDVLLQVAYQSEHDTNVAMTLDAMQQTVAFLSEHLGPFPGSTLTLVEKPDAGPTGYALPQLILIGSRVGFRARQDDGQPFSQAYRRAVHETAHQWFGHLLGNGVEQDSAFLVESMAKYIELVMLERHYGSDAMRALVDYERERYMHAENYNNQPMVSLISAESPHDRYSRATLAFAELRGVMGDQPIMAALSKVAKKHQYPQKPASSLDFVSALIKQVPEHQALIEKLLVKPIPISNWFHKNP